LPSGKLLGFTVMCLLLSLTALARCSNQILSACIASRDALDAINMSRITFNLQIETLPCSPAQRSGEQGTWDLPWH